MKLLPVTVSFVLLGCRALRILQFPRWLSIGQPHTSLVRAKSGAHGFIVSISVAIALPSISWGIAQQYKLPPIDRSDSQRCTLVSSSMGQANAARDKLYDLRECDLRGQSAADKDLSGMIAADADFTDVDFKNAQISK
jgi:hypothetical protein